VDTIKINKKGVRFDVLTAMVSKCSIFGDITLYSLLKVNRRSGEVCRFHLRGRKVSQTGNKHQAGT
jgi:hypothetical protein